MTLAVQGSFGNGAVFGVQISPSTPFVCALAAEGEDLHVWDFKSSVQGFLNNNNYKG